MNRARRTDDRDQILFGQKGNFCLLLRGVVRGETPLRVEVRRNLREYRQITLFVLRLAFLLPLFEAEYVNSTAIAAAGQPLRV